MKQYIWNDCGVCMNPDNVARYEHDYTIVISFAQLEDGSWVHGYDTMLYTSRMQCMCSPCTRERGISRTKQEAISKAAQMLKGWYALRNYPKRHAYIDTINEMIVASLQLTLF